MNVVQVKHKLVAAALRAAAAVGIMQGLLDNKVQVDLPGGSLLIEWEGVGSPLYMTGDATHIYDGNIHL